MMVRGAYSQLMAPGLHDIFLHWQDLMMREVEYEHLFHTETSDNAFEDELEMAGLGPMPEKPEGKSVTFQDAIQGGTLRYQHTTYALAIRTSFELVDDDKYGIINQVPKALSRSAHFVKELKASNVFNLGFTTVKTIDGETLFNNTHPLLGGVAATNIGPGVSAMVTTAGTYPNRPATDVDLSISALQLAIRHFERLTDATGTPIMLRPRMLVIPPEQKWIAREMLGSAYKPFTADNEINSMLKEDLSYFVYHYLTSTTAWFLLCDKEATTLKFKTRQDIDEDFADDFDTQSIKQLSKMRFSTGVTNWLGTWGSAGA